MKRSSYWNPAFSQKLAQSANARNTFQLKRSGYSLYRLYKSVIEELPMHPYYYKLSLGSMYGTVTLLDEVRWLKPKHVTLIRMKGTTVTPLLRSRVDREEKVGYNLDIKVD